MQILIPISGYSPFFTKEEFYFPKPLIEVAGKPMIELVVRQFHSFNDAKFIFVIDKQDAINFSLDKTINLICGNNSKIIYKNGETSGSLCSCMLSIDSVDHEQPLVISNSDQIIEESLFQVVEKLRNNNAAAGVATFKSVHPRWSYVIENESSLVTQTFEKEVKSSSAIAGFYYFQKAEYFFKGAQQVIKNDVTTAGNFFISSVLNEIILNNEKVMHFPIEPASYHSFYTPSKIEEFERTCYAKLIREDFDHDTFLNILIPAAGEGTRFKNSGWKKPKPFIDVDGKPLIERVVDNINCKSSKITLLLREKHISNESKSVELLSEKVHRVIPISKLTEGTVSTVLLGRVHYDNSHPLLIANSDQLVDFDVDSFIQDCRLRNLDGSILVFRDVSRNEKWSFVNVNSNGLVTEVAEKKAISDLATVGIYLFSRGSDFVSSAIDMIAANDRVNNEFYTCPVYNYMIKAGAKIGVYEIEMKSMSGLGTPTDLNRYLNKINAPISNDCP